MSEWTEPGQLPDETARGLIREDLERNFLVEAGAGSGKTTALVDRMVALIRRGACDAKNLAAVTFTRKAAAELRERFQEELEAAARALPGDTEERQRVVAAIRDLDEAFLGTIHAFCAKLLRERPLDAGLDPGFTEVLESEAYRLARRFWTDYLERLAADGDPVLGELRRLGLEPDRLQSAFLELVENPDVEFATEEVEAPEPDEVKRVRDDLDALLDRALAMLPAEEPEAGWDGLQSKVRTLAYWRRSFDWGDPATFFDALSRLYGWRVRVVQKRWSTTGQGKADAKQLGADFTAFMAPEARAFELMDRWFATRYPVAMELADRAARTFAHERKELGLLNFQDLLVLTADLLRDDPLARQALAKRYTRVLVDEFQDTDPLQAEILLLLASNPGSSEAGVGGLPLEAGAGEDWRDVIPRPGALFVVGDPKQSIYRFRRADISLYDFVKSRFDAFGQILRLEANFRSLPAVEDVVKGVFDDEERFGAEDSELQAAFAPLRTQRRDGPGIVSSYPVEGGRQEEMALDDAARIASCIQSRVEETGDREPGDFLVLTRNRKYLGVYAKALEDRNLPVEVSGAGVGFEAELEAFVQILRSLADPGDQVLTLSALIGPLFGVPLDEVLAHRRSGRRLSFFSPPDDEATLVDRALARLHGWWRLSSEEPADVIVDQLMRETGLLPLAAAGPLGQLRAGAVVYVLDAVRAAAVGGDASLAGAVAAIETALAWDDAEAPLIPGRKGAVRVMNLHRAKGLEAPVVFLAAPFGERDRTPDKHVSRDRGGVARGSMLLSEGGQWKNTILAKPLSWEKNAAVESRFDTAEKVRLLYVAATRARDELWIARQGQPSRREKSPWEPLEAWLDDEGRPQVDLTIAPLPETDVLLESSGVSERVRLAEEARARAASATYELQTVTAVAKGDEPAPDVGETESTSFGDPATSPTTTRGFEWGSVVHAALAAAGRGVAGSALEGVCRSLLVEYERPVDALGAPTELAALMELIDGVQSSDVWKRAMEAEERFIEMPFAVDRSEGMGSADVLEGVIDLVFREGAEWVIADYKTDQGDDPDFPDRVPTYRRQVDLYAESWQEAVGAPVKERMLIFTTQGRVERW